jgi:hypothetical protein
MGFFMYLYYCTQSHHLKSLLYVDTVIYSKKEKEKPKFLRVVLLQGYTAGHQVQRWLLRDLGDTHRHYSVIRNSDHLPVASRASIHYCTFMYFSLKI